MPLITDAISQQPFSALELTDWINKRKYVPRLVSQLMMFEETGSQTVDIALEERDGQLGLYDFSPRGGNPEQHTIDKRVIRKVSVPHIAAQHKLHADELLGIRAPGQNFIWALLEAIQDRLSFMTDRLDATLEYHRVNALRGLVLDKAGGTVMSMFTEFGVSQEAEVAFDLTAASPASGAVTRKVNTTLRTMRLNAGELEIQRVIGLCSGTYWDDLTANKEVQDSYRFDGASEFLRQQISEGSFRWRGVTWIEYDRLIGATPLVPADKVILVPIAPSLYRTVYAPADFLPEDMTGENRGLARYVPRPTVDPENPNNPRFMRLDLQSNPLCYCTRPKVLMIGRRGA